MALTRTDVLLAVYVLTALDYEVSYLEDAERANVTPRLAAALREFQRAANREHTRALKVDGVLGPDTLNALAFYATQSPYTVARLNGEAMTAEERRDVQALIDRRRNIPWGMGSGGGSSTSTGGGGGGGSSTSTGGGGGGGSSTSTGGGGSSTSTGGGGSSTSQASMFGTGAKAVLVLGVLGALALGGAKAMERYEDRRGLPAPVQRAVAYGRRVAGGRKRDDAAREVPAGPPPAPRTKGKSGTGGGGVLGAVAALKRV